MWDTSKSRGGDASVRHDDQRTTVHIVAHTHWDREWYLTFEQFRINLVRLIDQLVDMMRDGSYEYFLLDGQI